MSVQAFEVENYDQQLILLRDLINQITIKTLPDAQKPSIGVIAKKHSSLESVAALLNSYNIPIKYEKSDNILEYTHIKWIVQIMRFCVEYNKADEYSALDSIIQDIVSFPFWGVGSIALFDLITQANAAKKLIKESSYLSSMLVYEASELLIQTISQELATTQQELIRSIAKWLINLGTNYSSLSLGQILDIVLGVEDTSTTKKPEQVEDYEG